MSNLTAIFGDSQDKEQDSEKLLNLYWNRAELKKEFAEMRKEQFRLRDRIREEEGATVRMQQKLEHLEELLTDPVWVHNVMVFFQMRGVARQCEIQLAKFAEQLKVQREEKKHRAAIEKWESMRNAESHEISESLLTLRENIQFLEDKLQSERNRLIHMNGLFKFFRRRSLTAELDSMAAQIDSERSLELELTQQLDEINDQAPPDNEGLDISTKRGINMMILSYAHQLIVNFGDDDLARCIKETTEKSVGAINYGGRSDCNDMLDRVEKALEKMDKVSSHTAELTRRAQALADSAEFRADDDAVPIAASLPFLYRIDGAGNVKETECNVLRENYWNIDSVLSR